MNATRRPTRSLVLAAASAAVVGVVAPPQTATAQPMPNPHGVVRAADFGPRLGCADQLRDLTIDLRKAGFSGQASHIVAELMLGC